MLYDDRSGRSLSTRATTRFAAFEAQPPLARSAPSRPEPDSTQGETERNFE